MFTCTYLLTIRANLYCNATACRYFKKDFTLGIQFDLKMTLHLHTDLQLVLGEHELSKAFTVPNALRKKSQTILIRFQYRELPKLSCRHRKDFFG